jgi:hypothetical protein
VVYLEKSERFRLVAHSTVGTSKNRWNTAWTSLRSRASLEAMWPDVDAYLELAIPRVPARYLKEGTVQAGISHFAAPDLVVIDREAVVCFASERERKAVRDDLLAPLVEAVGAAGAGWWKPKLPGNECDAVAINRQGDVLAIEVKPSGVEVAWAPLQARHYADLLQRWATETPNAAQVLRGMYEQRLQLGLVNQFDLDWDEFVRRPVTVVPVVAIRAGLKEPHASRMVRVAERVASAPGLSTSAIQFRDVNLVGRMSPPRTHAA